MIIAIILAIGIFLFVPSRFPSTLPIKKIILLLLFIFVPLIFLGDLYGHIFWSGGIFDNGMIILPVFYIFLNATFLIDTIRRISFHPVINEEKTLFSFDQLTPREQEVATLLLEGITYGAIADRLSVSHATIKTHCANIYQKLGIHTRSELFHYLLHQK